MVRILKGYKRKRTMEDTEKGSIKTSQKLKKLAQPKFSEKTTLILFGIILLVAGLLSIWRLIFGPPVSQESQSQEQAVVEKQQEAESADADGSFGVLNDHPLLIPDYTWEEQEAPFDASVFLYPEDGTRKRVEVVGREWRATFNTLDVEETIKVSNNFVDYYTSGFAEKGWAHAIVVDNTKLLVPLADDINGSSWGYVKKQTKNEQEYIRFMIMSWEFMGQDSTRELPLECPCALTLSFFAGDIVLVRDFILEESEESL